MNLLDGRVLKDELKVSLKDKLDKLSFRLRLVIIRSDGNDGVDIYVRQKIKMASYLGIDVLVIKFSEGDSEDEISSVIRKLNDDELVDGVMIQLPFRSPEVDLRLRNCIDPLKDVDGLSTINVGRLWQGDEGLIPCTALGIIRLLDFYDIDVKGKVVCVVNRSDLVGKPLMALLIKRGATVVSCNSNTSNLENFTRIADVLVTAVGCCNFIRGDMIKRGAVIVDAGICYVDGKVSGDVDMTSVLDRVSYITPVPGGVGPVTVIMLMYNLYYAGLRRRGILGLGN